MKRIGAAIVALLVVVAAIATWRVTNGRAPAESPGPSEPRPASSSEIGSVRSAPPSVAPDGGSPEPPAESPPVVDGPPADVPIVPVAQFRTAVSSVTRADVQAALDGTSSRWDALELVSSEGDAMIAGLGVDRPAGDPHLVLAPNAATLGRDLAGHRKHLAVLRADAVVPRVR